MPERSPAQRRAWTTGAVGAAVIATTVLGGLALSDDEEPWRREGATISVGGWIPYWQVGTGLESLSSNRELFHDVSLMAYAAREGDVLVPFDGLPDDAVERLHSSAGDVDALVTIFDEMPSGGMAALLADPARRARHVEAIVEVVEVGGFDGVDLDYEQFAFADDRSTWPSTQPAWVAFLRELTAALHARGGIVVVSVPPIYDDGSPSDRGAWVYDYAAMGGIVDRIRVMAYDYSVGEPGPIAPIDWVRGLAEAIAEVVPPRKVDLGVPVYGRDWVVSTSGTCPAGEEPSSRAIATDAAAELVDERDLVAVWDDTTAEVRTDYTDVLTGTDAAGAPTSCTVQRTVRWLDAAAIQARAQLAWRTDLHGVALWALGYDDVATWRALADARYGLRPGETLATSATTG